LISIYDTGSVKCVEDSGMSLRYYFTVRQSETHVQLEPRKLRVLLRRCRFQMATSRRVPKFLCLCELQGFRSRTWCHQVQNYLRSIALLVENVQATSKLYARQRNLRNSIATELGSKTGKWNSIIHRPERMGLCLICTSGY